MELRFRSSYKRIVIINRNIRLKYETKKYKYGIYLIIIRLLQNGILKAKSAYGMIIL